MEMSYVKFLNRCAHFENDEITTILTRAKSILDVIEEFHRAKEIYCTMLKIDISLQSYWRNFQRTQKTKQKKVIVMTLEALIVSKMLCIY